MSGPLIGRTLGGRFSITGHIGEGAMASVFRATDAAQGGREVAIKVMHPHLVEDRTFTARFKREAQAARMIVHPSSVSIVEVGAEGSVHFIAMELCPGRDLREVLRAEGPQEPVRAARILATVSDALAAAHKLGVVHRDLKPENVMVDRRPDGTDIVKVLDFGIAKLVDSPPRIRVDGTDSDPPPALTQFGVVVGTPAYMSPEQCRGQPLDGRSDLYTCGILLFQLVTGKLPFDTSSPLETAGKQAFEPPPKPSMYRPGLDADLEALILRLLAKDPAARPQHADELTSLLGAWIARQPAPAPRPGTAAGPGARSDLRGLSKTVPMNAAAVQQYLADRAGNPAARAALDTQIAEEISAPEPPAEVLMRAQPQFVGPPPVAPPVAPLAAQSALSQAALAAPTRPLESQPAGPAWPFVLLALAIGLFLGYLAAHYAPALPFP